MKTKCRWYLPVYLSIIICWLAALAISPASAASLGDIPVTAEYAAGMRAIAAMDPDEKIRNPDYMAQQFLTAAFWFWGSLSKDYEKSKQFIKFYRVGSYYATNACTKHIDGILEKMAHNGLYQVVNIGAGLDSRPYRLGKAMPGVRFFEIDLPAMIEEKKRRLNVALGQVPDHVAYVPIDFNTQNIPEELKKAGYDPGRKTFFIWEGVTMYISKAAVDSTLRFIASQSPPGSSVVFDYMPAGAIQGDFKRYPDVRSLSFWVSHKGEPFVFGMEQEESEPFVNQRGLKVRSDLGPKDLEKRYLTRKDGSLDGPCCSAFRILHAAVP